VHRRLACALATAAALLVPLAATPAAPAATPSITGAMLGRMVLPRGLLGGGRFDALPKSWSTGQLTIADAPRYTLDPRDTAKTAAADGWIAGYDQSWGPGFAPDGAFFGGTTVQLFKSEATGALQHVRQAESFRIFRGRAIEGGWTLVSTQQWSLPALTPDAFGVRNTFRSKAGTFYDTEVHLRVGRVLGEVGIVSSRNTDLAKAAESNGRLLLQRIRRVAGAAK
jgi:hypothetical protein